MDRQHYPNGDDATPDSDGDEIPTLEQLAHQVRQLRAEELRWHVARETSLRRLADGQLSLIDAVGHLQAGQERLSDLIVLVRAAQGEQAEQIGRILAELAHRARQDSVHEDAIAATRTELALARAKWLGWRGLAVTIALAIFEALKHWIGG